MARSASCAVGIEATSRFSDLRTDPSFQRFLLQIAAEWRALLEHSLAHGHVAPDDLQIVYDLIRNEENMIDDIVHFLGGKVTVALFEHTELPEWCADLRQTLTLVAPGSRAGGGQVTRRCAEIASRDRWRLGWIDLLTPYSLQSCNNNARGGLAATWPARAQPRTVDLNQAATRSIVPTLFVNDRVFVSVPEDRAKSSRPCRR